MKRLLKQTILTITAIMTLSTQSNAIFGVGDVVYDPAAVAQAIEQVTLLKKQIEQAKKTACSACGVRDAVKMYKDMKQLTGVMKEFKVTLEDLDIDNPQSKIGQMAQKIFEDNQIFDNCNLPCNSELQKQVCKDGQVRNVGEIATAMVYGDELGKAAKRLENLGKKLATSKDIKTSQDIGNALTLELAQLQISKSRIDMMGKMNASKCKADADRLKQAADEKWGVPVQIDL